MSGTEKRRREFQVGVRLLPEERTALMAAVEASGLSAGELLRRAYFLPDLARRLYEANGFSRYGRDLGPWEDVEGEPRTHYEAQAVWLLMHDGTIRAEVEAVECDHPGLDHSEPPTYCWPCPKCGVCKFIGHGPLCVDCYQAASA